MQLTTDQIRQFQEDGVLLVADYFSRREVDILRLAMETELAKESPGRVLERDNKTVRALHGCHTSNEVFQTLTLHPRLLEPAQQILGGDVYIYQFKINLKAAFTGDIWPWHQDFVFWREEDGMPEPRVINAAIFLDETNEFNGPMYFIPGSQKEGVLDAKPKVKNGDWVASFSADLKYTLDTQTIASLMGDRTMLAPKGPAGSVIFFHGNLAHGSPPNMSPYNRAVVIVTYNSVENLPVPRKALRPDFLVGRDQRPLHSVADDALIRFAPTVH